MATIAALRARVRTRLEENTAAVWTDDELDECVTGALDAYGWLFPAEVITTAAVLDGATSTPAPTGTQAVQRVILSDGTVVPRRRRPLRATSGEELAWELYAGTIHFTDELSAQTLTIWHSAAVTLDDLPESDEGLVTLGAVVQALEARAIQDFKRGGPLGSSSYDAVITRARDDFERALARRSRRVRDGMVAG
ncbi:MAG: hypothetical protein M3439_08390 [Chloroflexota bacterium]|nr:hypothetical protein [Chloroflexota bacterium]